MRDVERFQKKRCSGVLWCSEVPRMGASIEQQSPWNRECPRGKPELGDHGSPRVSNPWKEAARGKGRDKAQKWGLREGAAVGGLAEEGAHSRGTWAPEFPE